MKRNIEPLVEKVKAELKASGIPVSDNIKEVVINNRTKRRLGACRVERRFPNEMRYTIELSKNVLDCGERELCGIIAHELIHTCPQCFNHGKKWKEYGEKAAALGYTVKRTAEYKDLGIGEPEGLEKVKYAVRCCECGRIYERKRMCPLIRNPKRYRCGKCGGQLKRE